MAHVSDFGAVVTFTVTEAGLPKDISDWTTKQILVRSPTGLVTTLSASFSTDGTDGVLTVTIPSTLFTTYGTYKFQAKGLVGTSAQYSSDVVEVSVLSNVR